MKKIREALRELLPDGALILGAALVVYGAWQGWGLPVGCIAAGAALILGAVLGGGGEG